jgi:hypothetical protein
MQLYGNWIYMISTYAISSYHHWSCEFESRPYEELDTTLCDKVCQLIATGRLFSPGTPVFSTNKTDCHVIAEILLKVALNTRTLTLTLTLNGKGAVDVC